MTQDAFTHPRGFWIRLTEASMRMLVRDIVTDETRAEATTIMADYDRHLAAASARLRAQVDRARGGLERGLMSVDTAIAFALGLLVGWLLFALWRPHP